jgi:hypothetical protein
LDTEKEGKEMRAISLWQPWAELIARKLKYYETRSFECEPGELAIHAAMKPFRSDAYSREFRTQLLMDEVDPYWLKYGVVLCVVEVLNSRPVEDIRHAISDRERMYGNYDSTCERCGGEGKQEIPAGTIASLVDCSSCKGTGIVQRYAWQLKLLYRLEKPLEVKGRQRWFFVNNSQIARPA